MGLPFEEDAREKAGLSVTEKDIKGLCVGFRTVVYDTVELTPNK